MIASTARIETIFEREDRQARELLKGLSMPQPWIYWTDFFVTCGIGWSAFAFAARLPIASAIPCGLVSVLALYRALLMVHEISHVAGRAVRGFEACWNAAIGFPLLLPSFMYCGVHQSHHSLSSYGTEKDPEYLPFAQSQGMTIVFALESFLMPLALLFRFLVLAPLGLVCPPFQQWLTTYASSLTMNFKYRREATPELVRRVRIGSVLILSLWAAAFAFLPLRVFVTWLAVVSVISFINTLRTLVAHRYENDGEPLNREGQLLDSLDTPGGPWTELWAPMGLRFHALHHYFPGIPYHNLYKAHQLLMNGLPGECSYKESLNPSLVAGLHNLLTSSVLEPAVEAALTSDSSAA